jgi:tetratricopeptide (TPR) repeat protein
MKANLESAQTANELAYEKLVTVVEASKGTLALLIAVCDDSKLRDRIIQRYEQDLKPEFETYQLQLAKTEPSLRAALGAWAEQQSEPVPSTMFTVTGAESLLWFNLKDDDGSRTEVEKFFGYLQWGREGLREFPYPIVLWITSRILKNLSLKAPDFWSWRKGVFRFISDEVPEPSVLDNDYLTPLSFSESDSFFLPLEDLQKLISKIEQREGTEAPLLSTLYSRLAQVYQRRIERGEAKNLQEEKSLAIENYQKAIALQTKLHQGSALINTLEDLGRFLSSQGKFKEAILLFQQSLQMARTIGDRYNEAYSLVGLGHAYDDLGEYTQAIEFYEQSLAIQRERNDRLGEAAPLSGLGNAYYDLGEYAKAIEFHERSLAIQREMNDRRGESASITHLGNAYFSLGQYAQALEFYEQSLAIKREIGAFNDEANCIMNLGNVYFSLGQYLQAIEFYEQSLIINRKIGDFRGEADVWFNLGSVLTRTDRISDAIDAYRNARQLYADIELHTEVQGCDKTLQRLSSTAATIT